MADPEADAARKGLSIRGLVARLSGTFIWRWFLRLLEIEFLDRSTALAAKAFVALIPLVAVVVVFLPTRLSQPWIDATSAALGTPGQGAADLATSDPAGATLGVIGLVLLVFYATSFGTSLQRLYRRVWRRPASERANRLKILEWLTVFVLYSTLVAMLSFAVSPEGEQTLTMIVEVVGGAALWTWTARILLGREVRWRALWLSGLLTQVGLMAYSSAALLWLPQALESNTGSFGAYGAAVTMLAVLIGCSFIVVVAAALAPVVAESKGRLGRLLSGADPLTPDAPPSLPPPSSSPLRMWLPGVGTDEP
jgi:membrane protein